MATAGTAASHDPLPHSVVLEAGVREAELREEVQQHHSEVSDGVVACTLLGVGWNMLRCGESYLKCEGLIKVKDNII